jgi:hypothetical protein
MWWPPWVHTAEVTGSIPVAPTSRFRRSDGLILAVALELLAGCPHSALRRALGQGTQWDDVAARRREPVQARGDLLRPGAGRNPQCDRRMPELVRCHALLGPVRWLALVGV